MARLPERLWRVAEVADYLGRSPDSIYWLVSQRKIPHAKAGGILYFDPAEIAEWLARGRKPVVSADEEAAA